MEFYIPRKLMLKAWNAESRLLVRLDNISCVKGELVKKDHILLQYTGLKDKHGEDLYEMDVALWGSEKFIVRWGEERNGWVYVPAAGAGPSRELSREAAYSMVRLCSYFESSIS